MPLIKKGIEEHASARFPKVWFGVVLNCELEMSSYWKQRIQNISTAC